MSPPGLVRPDRQRRPSTGRSEQVLLLGGRRGAVKASPPNPHWTDWQTTKVDVEQQTKIAVRQHGVELEGFINGALVGTFRLNQEPAPGPVGIGFKTVKGRAGKVKFQDFSVTEI